MVKKRNKIYNGKIIKLYKDIITIKNKNIIRETIAHPGSVVLIPVFNKKTKEIVLVKQFRYAINKYILELPAGTRKINESTFVCAKRELEEETGYKAGKLKKISEFYPSPGILAEKMHLFLATDLIESKQKLDVNEDIKTFKIKLSKALKMVKTGRITDAKTIIGILMFKFFYS